MKKKIIIYDFDGTLTTSAVPRYEILSKMGYNSSMFNSLISDFESKGYNNYLAYAYAYLQIFKDTNTPINKENVCYGAESISYSKGVLNYLEKYGNVCDHYLISSGFVDYINKTVVAKYFKGIFGSTFIYEGENVIDIEKILSDKDKPITVKSIINLYDSCDVLYIGDGDTDIEAMKYVKSLGGKSVFIANSPSDYKEGIDLKNRNIIDDFFDNDYSTGSKLETFIASYLKNAI